MKKSARIALHCLLAMVLTVPLAACGSDTKDTTPKKDMSTNTREQLAELSKSDERLTGELENKTIKWMSDWDINSDDTGKTTPIELAVFQEATADRSNSTRPPMVHGMTTSPTPLTAMRHRLFLRRQLGRIPQGCRPRHVCPL
mgnify:CR=1 FL=1